MATFTRLPAKGLGDESKKDTGHVDGHCVGHNARGTNAICRVTADSQSIRHGIRHNRCMYEHMHDDCRITRVGIPIIPRECDE